MSWPNVEAVASERLRLEPLSVEHALGMVKVLADPAMYEYIGGEAPSLEELQRRYAAQAVGHSDDGSEAWFNWIVTPRDSDAPIGFVQATLGQNGPDVVAAIAWVISPIYQGHGMASEATRAMMVWLRAQGVSRFTACVHPEHRASMGVARNQGLHPTPILEDGEVLWES